MSKNYAEVEIAEHADGTEILPDDSASKSSLASGLDRRRRSSLAVGWRSRSVVIQRLPVQEAMKNGNSKNYFNALRRVDFASLAQNWTPQENEEFLTSHLIVSGKHSVSDSRFIQFSTRTQLKSRILGTEGWPERPRSCPRVGDYHH